MPRKARRKSATGVYHIILRGINKQIIFEDADDFRTFISVLEHYRKKCDFGLYAYCLMSNHIHLLIRENKMDIGDVMKKIEVTFVKWYNEKYQRIGHLFQERYKSEPVETERYFLTVFRYIHQNPRSAGLEKEVGETYLWSSYREYEDEMAILTDVEDMMSYFDSREELLDFVNRHTRDMCMEDYTPRTLSDEESLKVIAQMTGCVSLSDFQHLDIEDRDSALQRLLDIGFSIRQLSRLTGISRKKLCSIRSH